MSSTDESAPLAARLRPQTLDHFVGQDHLLGPGKPLAKFAQGGALHSMLLWGPPGTGKTTLARLLAQTSQARWIALSAVLSGVKDVREAVAQAQAYANLGEATVLFVDEVHRFNKAQQDAFLPHVEQGTVTLIGATTENPSFEVNAALLSRARVYVLQALGPGHLHAIFDRAMQLFPELSLTEAARDLLVDFADGDARRGLNLLEVAAQLAQNTITDDIVASVSGNRMRRFDKGGDLFYEQISALHKAVRGSAPDAALYWFCRMLDGGCDPLYIARRLVRMASEDVGNADPRALQLALAGWDTFNRLGHPEGELALAQVVLYLASVPKSNAAYVAYGRAQQLVAETGTFDVPMHLRNAPTSLMKGMGYGADYRYAHDEPERYAAGENYFPEGLTPPALYEPIDAGLEGKIAERLSKLRALDRTQKDHSRKS